MFDRDNEFDDLLAKTNEVRDQLGNVNEYVDSMANMLSIRIQAIMEGYKGNILSLSEELKDRLFKAVRENFDKSINEVRTKKEIEF
jgi:hypothetical protein